VIERLREWLSSTPGKIAGVVVALLLVALVWFQVRANLGPSSAAAISNERVFICAETGKTFKVHLTVGTPIPALSPYSKKETGYPPELCFWTADGQVKEEPTYVLLNEYVHKPGPTFCPDCGRLVTLNNRATTGHPPPTKQELEGRAQGRSR
jgi:hypothetical protein